MSKLDESSTAFVFAGGGSLGAVEVGMLSALTGSGVAANLVIGSSVGAINAAYFAGNPTPEGVQQLTEVWCGLRRADIFPAEPLRSLVSILWHRESLVSAAGLRRILEARLPYTRLEDAAIACHVVATDLLSGEEVMFSSGPVVETLLASSAIPGVFPPVHLNGRHLVDGGIASNTPIAAAVRLGAARVVVLPTGLSCGLRRPPSGPLGVAIHALNLLIARQLVMVIVRFASATELRVVPPLCPLARSPYDFSNTAELINRAAAFTQRWIDAGGLERASVPASLNPHTH